MTIIARKEDELKEVKEKRIVGIIMIDVVRYGGKKEVGNLKRAKNSFTRSDNNKQIK